MMIMKKVMNNRRGAAMVEFAIVAMLFFLLVFGIMEFSLLMKDYLTLNQAVREGARAAAVGITNVSGTILASAPTLDTTKLTNIQTSYRVFNGTSWPTTWISGLPGTVGATDNIQIKVRAQYAHTMVTGTLFGSGPLVVHAEMVMRME
jgi:Flp pilus assembly protein TadG